MKVSEFIKILQNKCKDEDLEIEFLSYEWDDDLEGLNYHKREFEKVSKCKDVIQIYVTR